MKVAAVVLAAGASRRMGENKMLLELDGEPLVRRTVGAALAAGLSPVVVVVGRDAEEVRAALKGLPCDVVVNPEFTGPTSCSLHRGLEHLPTTIDAAVIVLGDMVFVTTEMLRAVVDSASGSDARLTVSRYDDVSAPPLLFRRALFPELLAWHGEGCGKAVVQRHQAEAVYLDWPLDALTDLDTPEDLAAARRLLGPLSS